MVSPKVFLVVGETPVLAHVLLHKSRNRKH
jgi:hypothetical protein